VLSRHARGCFKGDSRLRGVPPRNQRLFTIHADEILRAEEAMLELAVIYLGRSCLSKVRIDSRWNRLLCTILGSRSEICPKQSPLTRAFCTTN
jgi:hypothetical protein